MQRIKLYMKQIYSTLIAVALVAGLSSCHEQYTTYSDREYVMFADSISENIVLEGQEYFSVAVASTVARDYDRTFGVEIIDEGSNAIEGVHYRLLSNSITIPAGKLAAEVRIHGYYDNIEAADSLGFGLRLVMPEALKFDNLYNNSDQTKVVMAKVCPFSIDNFTGWCVVTSMMLYEFGGPSATYQRLVKCERSSEPNTIVIRNFLYEGYDVKLRFNDNDPAKPLLEMDNDQILSDEASVFGQILGDDHILCGESPYHDSYYNSCLRFATLWLNVYVYDLGNPIGTVGQFYNILEWVSDEEAERLQREEGM